MRGGVGFPRELKGAVVAEQQAVVDVVSHFIDGLDDDVVVSQAGRQRCTTAPCGPADRSHHQLRRTFTITAQRIHTATPQQRTQYSQLSDITVQCTSSRRTDVTINFSGLSLSTSSSYIDITHKTISGFSISQGQGSRFPQKLPSKVNNVVKSCASQGCIR